MANRKEVTNQISSVKNIRQITRAMEMVAAARLRRAEMRIADLRPYAQAMRQLTKRAAAEAGTVWQVPVLEEREQVGRVAILLITGDRGLAGAFNANILREGLQLRDEQLEQGREVVFYAVGRRGDGALTFRKQEVAGSWTGFTDRPAFSNARDIGDTLICDYIEGRVDRVEVIYNRYVSPLTQHVHRQRLLPVQQAEVVGEGAEDEHSIKLSGEAAEAHARSLWEYEPDPEELLAELIPEYVNISLYRTLLESAASELGARMTAMRSAAENAETMIDDLTLEMNRVRQAEITQEILEVVGGAEALG
ncbi:MAG: F0F1 ATP synthase subunit gamma [Solirubrobacterales bacterium]|nr:F0F1 ATP synthase subunit gamma [Solirubrobacterales bacterium]